MSNNWRNDPITQKQLDYIMEMSEFSDFPLPKFEGRTKGEAYDYIKENNELAHTSSWALEHGY